MANSKIVYGNTTLIDLTGDTATASDVASGYVFFLPNGTQATGTATFGEQGASVVGTRVEMGGNTTNYTFPNWWTATDDEIAEAIRIANMMRIDLPTVFSKQTNTPTWATATDAQLERALSLYYQDAFTFAPWVGLSRSVDLSAMSASSGLSDTHVAQTVEYVLTQTGGKTLETPVNGHTECAFQFDQKDSLKEKGGVLANSSQPAGWKECPRRSWCNSTYKNALPASFASLCKPFINQSANSALTAVENTTDTFALRAEVEIAGTTTKSLSGEGSQIGYYDTSSNRVKKVNGSASDWGLRSKQPGYGSVYAYVANNGAISGNNSANTLRGIAPFGVM